MQSRTAGHKRYGPLGQRRCCQGWRSRLLASFPLHNSGDDGYGVVVVPSPLPCHNPEAVGRRSLMTTDRQPAGRAKEPWWLTIQHPGNISLPVNVVERGRWYHKQMRNARIESHTVDTCVLVLAAGVPFAVAAHAPSWVAALLGALAAVGTGLRQVFGWQKNWASFAVASGQIEAEIVRFGYGIGDYQEAATAAGRLAERVENITAAETGTWVQRVNEAHRNGNDNN
jgi:Protein of unknown function (DUF4231)